MMKTILTTICVVLVLESSASAELLAKDYAKLAGQAWFKSYMRGVGVGYGWANAELATRGHPRLFCTPAKLALYEQNYLDILDRYLAVRLREGRNPETILLEPLLLKALQDAFPCEKKNK